MTPAGPDEQPLPQLHDEPARQLAESLQLRIKKAQDAAWTRNVMDRVEAELARIGQSIAAASEPGFTTELDRWLGEVALVLQHSPDAARMLLLQRFVSDEAPVLVEALNLHDTFQIRRLLKQCLARFRAAREEALSML
jgi:hypothetical protein